MFDSADFYGRQLKLPYATAFNCCVYLGRFMMSVNFYHKDLMDLLLKFSEEILHNDVSFVGFEPITKFSDHDSEI